MLWQDARRAVEKTVESRVAAFDERPAALPRVQQDAAHRSLNLLE